MTREEAYPGMTKGESTRLDNLQKKQDEGMLSNTVGIGRVPLNVDEYEEYLGELIQDVRALILDGRVRDKEPDSCCVDCIRANLLGLLEETKDLKW